MKYQALFYCKIKVKILKCCLLQFLFGTLRVNKVSKWTLNHINDFIGKKSGIHEVEILIGGSH